MPFPKLSIREKVLLYLADVAPSTAAPPSLASTQVGIANATGVHRSHVSRALDALAQEGLVDKSRRRVPGFARIMIVCALTPPGGLAAKSVRDSLLDLVVDVNVPGQARVRQPLAQALGRQPGLGLWGALQELEATGFVAGAPPAARRSDYVWDLEEAPPEQGFVGRAAEVAALAAWLRTPDPSCIVEGPGGIGKSTLVAHAIRQANPRRHVLWLRLSASMNAERLLARLDGFLARLGRPLSPLPDQEPAAVLEQLPARIRGLPVLLVLDDVHKADEVLRSAFEGLATAAQRRGDLKVAWVGRTQRLPMEALRRAVRIDPSPLAEAECRELLAGLAVPAERHAELARRSGGSPLFLELLAVSRSGEAAREDFVRHLLGERGLPEQLQLLRSLSALRVPASPHALERLLPPAARAGLDGLLRSRLAFRRADGAVELHDEIRDALYAQLLPGERRALHEAWARAIDPQAGLEDAVEYLHHLSMSGRQSEAAWWALRNQRRLLEWARGKFTAAASAPPAAR